MDKKRNSSNNKISSQQGGVAKSSTGKRLTGKAAHLGQSGSRIK